MELGRTLGFGGPQVPPRGPNGGGIFAGRINPPFWGEPGAGLQLRGPAGLEFEMGIGEVAEAGRMMMPGPGRNGAAPPGYHWNKTGYFVKGPPPAYIEAGTKLVRNRRRNPLNPRAFDRALGRVSSAKRFGERLGRVTIRKKCACK
jgi:hypothetical protein